MSTESELVGTAQRIHPVDDDEFDTVGLGYVINPWDSVQFYGGYRFHTLDRDGVDDIEDIHAVMIGGRVKF